MLVTLLLVAAQLPPPSLPGADAPGEGYVERFQAALAALDRGEPVVARAGFLRAGERAPEAPVWRASAGVAAALAGDEAGARALFAAALERGYPATDLAALHPIGAAVAAGHGDEAPSGWLSVTAGGLRTVGGDMRYQRERASDPDRFGVVTHLVGHFVQRSGSAPSGSGRPASGHPGANVETYHVDPVTGRVTLVHPAERPGSTQDWRGNYGVSSFGSDDALNPWPRPLPFVRALRTGLLVDEVRASIETSRLVLAGVERVSGLADEARWVGVVAPRPRRAAQGGAQAASRGNRIDLARLMWAVDDVAVDPRSEAKPALMQMSLDSGALLEFGQALGLTRIFRGPDGAPVVGCGTDATFLLDPEGSAEGRAYVSIWLAGNCIVAAGCDGTWSFTEGLQLAAARVFVGDRLMPLEPFAPYLLDPLHVRSLARDAARAPRRFPAL
ncbi:MAG: hypothetical protein R3F49_21245 [Planctomycetota bacterium]